VYKRSKFILIDMTLLYSLNHVILIVIYAMPYKIMNKRLRIIITEEA
jgi:hypothetical protein